MFAAKYSPKFNIFKMIFLIPSWATEDSKLNDGKWPFTIHVVIFLYLLLLLFLLVVFLILTIAILNHAYLFCGSESACKSNACGKLNSIRRGFSLLTLFQSWSWCPSWIVTLGQESRGLQIGGWINCWHIPRPNRTLTYPHTHTDTNKHTVPHPTPHYTTVLTHTLIHVSLLTKK